MLAESLVSAPLLLLATDRPGYRPPWIEQSNVTQIALQRLTPEDGLTVIRSIVPQEQLLDDLSQTILSKAEGNPFFLEELTQAVLVSGEYGAGIAVPDTIQGVLMARIDRLPEMSKQLLQTASILGREFSLRLLLEIWEGPGRCEPLLPESERNRRTPELVLKLAHSLHFLGRFQEMLDILVLQKERLKKLDEPVIAGPYAFWQSLALNYLGEYEQSVQRAKQAIELAQQCSDEATMGKAYYVLARNGFWLCQFTQGIEYGRQAVGLLERTDELWWLGLAHWAIGFNYTIHHDGRIYVGLGAHCLLGHLAQAREVALQALTIAKDIKFSFGVGLAQHALGRIAQSEGTFADAERYLREAQQTHAAIQSRYWVARTHLDLTVLAHAQCNQKAVASHLQEAQAVFTALQLPKYNEHTAQIAEAYGVPFAKE